MNFKNQEGQTIIEAVVALGMIFIVIVAITIAIINAVSNSQFVKNQNLANKYAQQGMEFVRGIQAEEIGTFAQYTGTYSLPDDLTEFSPGDPQTVNVANSYVRSLVFSNNEAPCLNTERESISLKKVTVKVTWSSGKCPSGNRFCHDSTLVSCIPYEGNPNIQP